MSKVQNQPEDRKKTIPSKVVNIHLGVFFDGTSNNKLNIREYRNNKYPWYSPSRWRVGISDSYKSDFSNVAILSDYYIKDWKNGRFYGKVYIEGIATAPREKETDSGGLDNILSAANGTGEYGINGKVERGCKLVTSKICEILKSINKTGATIDSLYLDVFGFSRGAAAARRFISCIDNPHGDCVEGFDRIRLSFNVCLRKHFRGKGLYVEDIIPCFLGLFDTVSSYGYNFKDDVQELTLQVPRPQKVVQLVAGDEYRKNFALTRINTGNKTREEIILPGAHSDIGGSYCRTEKEDLILYRLLGKRGVFYIYSGCKSLDQLIDEGWFLNKTEQTRTISNEYSRIPLHIMYGYKKEVFNNHFLKWKSIPPALQPIKKRLESIRTVPLYGFTTSPHTTIKPLFKKGSKDYALVKSIRHSYLHLSAVGGIAHGPAKNNNRIIIDDNGKK